MSEWPSRAHAAMAPEGQRDQLRDFTRRATVRTVAAVAASVILSCAGSLAGENKDAREDRTPAGTVNGQAATDTGKTPTGFSGFWAGLVTEQREKRELDKDFFVRLDPPDAEGRGKARLYGRFCVYGEEYDANYNFEAGAVTFRMDSSSYAMDVTLRLSDAGGQSLSGTATPARGNSDGGPCKIALHRWKGSDWHWGEAVRGLRVGISLEKSEFARNEPIWVLWRIENADDAEQTILWHPSYFSPVFFEIGKKDERKDLKGVGGGLISREPSPPVQLVLRPGQVQEYVARMDWFYIHGMAAGIWEVAGVYGRGTAAHADKLVDRIQSGTVEFKMTDDLAWLRGQLKDGNFQARLEAASKLAPWVADKETVLVELRKLWPRAKTIESIELADRMARLGDRSRANEIVQMYAAVGRAPLMDDSTSGMLWFLLNWGGEDGNRLVAEYVVANDRKNAARGVLTHIAKRTDPGGKGTTVFWENSAPGKNILPVLKMLLEDKGDYGAVPIANQSRHLRFCDIAAIGLEKALGRDWGMKLELPEAERDAVVRNVMAEMEKQPAAKPD